MTSALIELRNFSRVFTTDTVETHAVEDINLSIRPGEYVSIEGPSGCGKSTLLHLLGLLDEPSSGEYRLSGVPTAEIDAEERRSEERRVASVSIDRRWPRDWSSDVCSSDLFHHRHGGNPCR